MAGGDICLFVIVKQGSQFCTVPIGMVGIYRTGKQTGSYNPPVSYRKKYQLYRLYRPVQKKVFFFFFSFVIFEFLLGQNDNLFVFLVCNGNF